MMQLYFITPDEIGEYLGVSKAQGYRIIRELNAELSDKGFRIQRARTVRSYFLERYGIDPKEARERERLSLEVIT